jgi:hypothetical protein
MTLYILQMASIMAIQLLAGAACIFQMTALTAEGTGGRITVFSVSDLKRSL